MAVKIVYHPAVVETRPLLPAAPRPARTKRRLKAPAQAEACPTTRPATMADAVRGALKLGPLGNGQIERLLVDKGFTTDSKAVTVLLCYLRNRGEIYKGDEDLRWRLAERVTR